MYKLHEIGGWSYDRYHFAPVFGCVFSSITFVDQSAGKTKGLTMTIVYWIAGITALILLVYLFTALLKAEKFG
jgi:K+-transporting ATPase KdpF subunit